MSDGIYIALSGALAQTDKLDVVASNLANAPTVGYQRMRSVFHAALGAAGAAPPGPRSSTELDTTRGAARVTGRALDVSLPAGSYLAVNTPRGERYTRAGSITVGADGTLATRDGASLVSEAGQPIRTALDKGEPTVSTTGEVWQDGDVVARLKVVAFPAPAELAPEGGSVLAATAASGIASASAAELTVGALEESNTSVVGSMTDLVAASRAFDAFQRAIDAFRDADQKVTSTVPNGDQ